MFDFLTLSVVIGEPHALPSQGATWAAIAYLVSIGTVGVFLLFLFVLQRWQASAVAYIFVLAPFVSVGLAAGFLGEETNAALRRRCGALGGRARRGGNRRGRRGLRPRVRIRGRGCACAALLRGAPRQ